MKKDGKLTNAALKKMGKSLDKAAKVEMYTWPPICTLIAHQPKRPDMSKFKK